jgi:Uma2 family endonuclease
MTTASATRPEAPAELPVSAGRLHRLTNEVYAEMGRLGLLRREDRVVLIEGLLVTRRNKGPGHVTAVENVVELLKGLGLAGYRVRQEAPIVLPGGDAGRDSMPEPDVVVARGTKATFKVRHPVPDEIALLVEVADHSIYEDRKMLALYARSGIPQVWIVNLNDHTVEVYWSPYADAFEARYRDSRTVGSAEDLALSDRGRNLGVIPCGEIFS